jgi:uncharacterized protein YrrD
MDLGEPSSYGALSAGTPVYSSDGDQIGKVARVLAVESEDVFDGIVIGEHILGRDHRFADADEVDRIYDRGVVLKLDRAGCEQLPKPAANPAAMRVDPSEPPVGALRQKFRRVWDRISGNY